MIHPVAVVKLGGSHLLRPDLLDAIDDWRRRQPAGETRIWIVGGGEVVESLRRLDAVRFDDSATVHWRAVSALTLTFQTLAGWIRRDERFADFHVQPLWQPADGTIRGDCLVDCSTVYCPGGPALVDPPLPTDWGTTTDSIAWALARHWAPTVAFCSNRATSTPTRRSSN